MTERRRRRTDWRVVDPLTQGALGAAAAQAVAPPGRVAPATFLGALSGMAPDLDVLIRSSDDPLLFLEYHRQLTHSLVFVPFGALLCAVVLFPIVRSRLSFAAAYVYALVGYATHGLLDACTSYGTQLLWPFTDDRIAWNNVAVVDPAVTLPLVALVAWGVIRGRPAWARVGLAWVVVYLLVGVVQRERAQAFGGEVASQRGHGGVEVVAKPSFGNLLVWKTIYEHDGRYYVDAVRLGSAPLSFPGDDIEALDLDRDLPWLRAESRQARDVERFRWFSDGFIALDPARPERVIDVRYSMLPNRIQALWGIELDPGAPDDVHARFFTERDASPDVRSELVRMLWPPSD